MKVTLERLMLAGTLCAAAVVAMGTAARAQTYDENYPICIQVYAPIQYISCRFSSIPQCQATAYGLGAMCVENPFYVASSPVRRRKR